MAESQIAKKSCKGKWMFLKGKESEMSIADQRVQVLGMLLGQELSRGIWLSEPCPASCNVYQKTKMREHDATNWKQIDKKRRAKTEFWAEDC